MGQVISFVVQKGGAGKTTSAVITSRILAENYKVLGVDLDGQGNYTETFTQQPIRYFRENNIGGTLEAIIDQNPRPYIRALSENFHIIPGSEIMGTFYQWLWKNRDMQHSKEAHQHLTPFRNTLNVVKDEYDFIIVDTPPELGYIMLNALTASNGVVVLFDTGKYCHSALRSVDEIIDNIIETSNPTLKKLGILIARMDYRRYDKKDFVDLVKETYGDLIFDTIIKNNAVVERVAYAGFEGNPEEQAALFPYRPFVKELIERVNK